MTAMTGQRLNKFYLKSTEVNKFYLEQEEMIENTRCAMTGQRLMRIIRVGHFATLAGITSSTDFSHGRPIVL